jgi:hypothetical protein
MSACNALLTDLADIHSVYYIPVRCMVNTSAGIRPYRPHVQLCVVAVLVLSVCCMVSSVCRADSRLKTDHRVLVFVCRSS